MLKCGLASCFLFNRKCNQENTIKSVQAFHSDDTVAKALQLLAIVGCTYFWIILLIVLVFLSVFQTTLMLI